MPATRADAVRNRGKLIAAAAQLFSERGVDVPLDDIAKLARVSIGTLYNHFPNRGALLDAVLPDSWSKVSQLAEAGLGDPDPWRGFTEFLAALFGMQAQDRAINESIARTPVGAVDMSANCGRAGEALESVLARAHDTGVVRADFTVDDLTTLVWSMSKVIAMSNGDDTRWRRHLGFVLDGLRA